MTYTRLPVALGLSVFLALPGFAQTAATPPPATTETPAAEAPAAEATGLPKPVEETFPTGVEEEAPFGTEYVAELIGDWQRNCVKTEAGADPCQLYQLLKEPNGNPVGELTIINLPPGGQVAAGATLLVPLEVDLAQQISVRVDSAAVKKYGYTVCSSVGCLARFGLTGPEVEAFKKGNKVTVTVVPFFNQGTPVSLEVSLKGFTAGLDAVAKANIAAEAAAKAKAATEAPKQ